MTRIDRIGSDYTRINPFNPTGKTEDGPDQGWDTPLGVPTQSGNPMPGSGERGWHQVGQKRLARCPMHSDAFRNQINPATRCVFRWVLPPAHPMRGTLTPKKSAMQNFAGLNWRNALKTES